MDKNIKMTSDRKSVHLFMPINLCHRMKILAAKQDKKLNDVYIEAVLKHVTQWEILEEELNKRKDSKQSG